ncbi:Peroxiredoxin [Nannocystis exedens]|uniref:Peroxiredoxin n=1 Tax=Nannocystis exedens TaxID=54 RepID=A0A1I2F2B5_9BACT|nr:redoxin domain-containing protein [Nannocystis exedens]PCC69590.1 thioredoxin peroxidase [Nannocystis exedens]SFE98858.1 Peroxiredoxin [Nannocystis exedens]
MGPSSILQPGATAPEFALKATPDQRLALSDFRGKPVVLAFYPADWSPVCSDQMAVYSEIIDEFRAHGAQLLGISCDGVWCHLAFARDRKLSFPLLSDFEPKGDVARKYGCYDDAEGVSGRALFVVDGEGRIAWSDLAPMGVNPGADGILAALGDLGRSSSRPRPQQGDRS